MRSTSIRGALLALALVAASCASGETLQSADAPTASTSADTTTAPTTTAAPTTIVDATTSTNAAPANDLVTLVGGGQLDLNSIEGTDTVLWFWAPW